MDLESKYNRLKEIVRQMGDIAVAFSGGADSSFLLKCVQELSTGSVMALTGVSETTPRRDLTDVKSLAVELGVRHIIVETRELLLTAFTENTKDRCYICKKHRFSALIDIAHENGFMVIVDGSNADDSKDYRPGMRACRELGIRSPLAEADLTKSDIRTLSQRMNLHTWDKPAGACLASRIPYFQSITVQKLKQIDSCEAFVRELGISDQVRVRHYDDMARIEIDAAAISKMAERDVRDRIVDYFKYMGFNHIALDMEGYRMGGLNL